jgi:energy-coupling factor transporter ATPase
VIKTKDLSFDYIRRDEEGNVESITRALDEVNISVKPGDFVAVLGANGSGKSTFAKHLDAILMPTEGSVYVNGMPTTDEDKLLDIRRTAGMVFQNPDNQIIGTIVEDDVGFGPENLGIPTEEIWERVDKALDRVGMTKYRCDSPNKLSGGQKQRVAIAGIMAMKPKCIILDEPTAMLDPVGRREVIKTAKELNEKEGVTVILITHYMEEVIEADRVIVMDAGKVVLEGTPRQIFSRVEQLKSFRLDVPQVTALAFELNKRGIPLPPGILTVKEFEEEYIKALSALEGDA